MSKTIKDCALLITITLGLTLLVWLPHFLSLPNFYNLNFSKGFEVIYRNFDGLEYIVIAKSFYIPERIAEIPQPLPINYYAAHFPGYSLFILLFAPIFGFLKSMLFVSLLFTIASAISFFFLVKDFNLSKNPLFLAIVFLILPARWLVVHSVGASEPVFIFFVILTIYFFMKFESTNKWLNIHLAGLFGLLAQLTRPPGILLFIALILYVLWRLKGRTLNQVVKTFFFYHPLILMPLGLLGLFYWFGVAYNDFWAYFHSGDNIHLTFPPFQVFNKDQFWVGDIWLEDIVYILLLGFLGGVLLLKQNLRVLGFFVLTYFVAASLITHRDISRYTLPAMPFLLIAFDKVINRLEFKIALVIISLGIYFYAQNYILWNVSPTPNLESFN